MQLGTQQPCQFVSILPFHGFPVKPCGIRHIDALVYETQIMFYAAVVDRVDGAVAESNPTRRIAVSTDNCSVYGS